MATKKYLDENGAVLLNQLLAAKFNTKADKTEIPKKTSELTNDSNFVSDANYVHTDNNYTATEKNKLAGVEAGAQVNKIETIKVNNVAQTITDKAVDITVPTNTNQLENGAGFITKNVNDLTNYTTTSDMNNLLGDKLDASLKGAANGLAELDANGKVPSSQLPAYVDDVIEGYYYNGKFYKEAAHTTEIPGETGKIYVDLPSDKTYRWGGSAYAEISSSLALGETSSTAYYGDKGKIAYDHATDANRLTTAKSSGFYKFATTAEGHIKSVANVAKSDLTGLGVEDANNKVTSISGSSTNTQYPSAKLVYDQLALKQDKLTAGDNINIANDGTISATDTTYNDFVGTDGTSAGTAGLVPGPTTAEAGRFLKADGTWAMPAGTVYTGGTRISISDSNVISTTAEINKIDSIKVDGTALTITNKTVNITGKENTSNKVTSISSSSTDTQYPSAKLLYDQLALKQGELTAGNNIDITNNTISTIGDTVKIISDNTKNISSLEAGIYKFISSSTEIYINNSSHFQVKPGYLLLSSDSDNTATTYFYFEAGGIDGGSTGWIHYGGSLGTKDASHQVCYLNNVENISNKVTSLSSSSTNTQYPSAKLVYDQLALKVNAADLVALTNQEVNNIFDFELANS